MASDWPRVRLESVTADITVGHVGTMAAEYADVGVPFLRSLNVAPYRLLLDDVKLVSRSFHQRLQKSALRPGDVVVVRTGKPGTAAVIPEWLPEANCSDLVIVRPGPGLNARFLTYFFNSQHGKDHVDSQLVGSVQKHFNIGDARLTEIALPPLVEQRGIAKILGDLDDKIELNRRMNETLESMARALFKSWFVDFDPVRAKMEGRKPSFMDLETAALFPDKLVTSALGEVPSGWRVGTLGDLMELKRGYDLPERERLPGCVPIISSSGPSAMHNEAKARGPGIVTGRYGTIGKVFYVTEDYWPLNTTLYVRDLKGNNILFLFQLLRLVDFAKYSDKAAVPGINRNHLHEEPVVLPPVALQQRFGAILSGWTALAAHNDAETNTLAALRDALIPRLLSGEVRVAA